MLGEEDINWNEVFQAFEDNINHSDLGWYYGCSDFWSLDDDILQFWISDMYDTYSSLRPVIDLEAECYENLDGELELNLTPVLSAKGVKVEFWDFDGPIIPPMLIRIAPAYEGEFVLAYNTTYTDPLLVDTGFLDTVCEMSVIVGWEFEVGRFDPFDPGMFNIEEQESGILLQIKPIPYD